MRLNVPTLSRKRGTIKCQLLVYTNMKLNKENSESKKKVWNKTCVCETQMPPGDNKVKNMTKISKSYILTPPAPPHPQGHVMSVKCEEPIDELTVQVWLLYHHPNFKYCTLFVSGTELQTDRRTDKRIDRRTDNPITRCPRQTFQAGGHKNFINESLC